MHNEDIIISNPYRMIAIFFSSISPFTYNKFAKYAEIFSNISITFQLYELNIPRY
mgnify:CR=1 FL=1